MGKKEWFSAQELAGLPGMPASAQGVLKRAKSEQYLSRPKFLGKGFEYAVSSCPAVTQDWFRNLELTSARYVMEKQNKPMAPVESAQDAINRIAADGSLAGTIAALNDWLLTLQQVAFTNMENTTGAEFSRSCTYFDLATVLIDSMNLRAADKTQD